MSLENGATGLASSPNPTNDDHITDAGVQSNQALVHSPTVESPSIAPRNRRVMTENTTRTGRSRATTAFGEIQRALTIATKPPRKVGQPPGFWKGLRSIMTASYLNLLLIFIPLSWAFHFAKPGSDTIIFVFSFLSIIPLAKLLAFATDDLSIRTGQTIAGLLNATLGNAVELIVSIIALTQCELQIVQSSLIGSILSNLLLVLGMCFFAGGTRFSEQGFGTAASQLNSSLLIVSVIAVLLPAAFDLTVKAGITNTDTDFEHDILAVSHGVAIILLFIYGSYLTFQLWSHKDLYDDHHSDVMTSVKYAPKQEKHVKEAVPYANSTALAAGLIPNEPSNSITARTNGATESGNGNTAIGDPEAAGATAEEQEEDEEIPQMTLLLAMCLLAVVTVLVAVTAEWLVDSINGLTASGAISKEFVGLILLPIVGNAAEHVTAVTVSVKDKLTLSIGVAVGSSIQIALFVIPFITTLGWILGKPLTLMFDPFESIVLFLSVITVNYVVADGKSNWLEGLILMSLYVILAVIFWYYPGSDPLVVLSDLKC